MKLGKNPRVWACWKCGKAPCSHPAHLSHFWKQLPGTHESQKQFSSYM